jgi:DNA-binding GntR family transcriptional regulator
MVTKLSGNHYLYSILYSLLGVGSRAVILHFVDETDPTTHRQIIDALKNRDEEAALKALRDDIKFTGSI